MNLFLRPIDDVTDVTLSIIWCMIILLTAVAYYIYTIMRLAFQELEEDGSNDTAEQEELLQLPSSRDQ